MVDYIPLASPSGSSPTDSQTSLLESATEVDESLRFRKKILLIAGIVILGLTIYWDTFYAKYGISFSDGVAQHWILHLALVGYLVVSGILAFFILDFIRYEIVTYFIPSREMTRIFRCMTDCLVGFCLPIMILPFWLKVREGTIECFMSRDCQSIFGMLYLAVVDGVCDTIPSLGKYKPNTLPTCEGICYLIPILSITMIPFILASYVYKTYYSTILNNRSALHLEFVAMEGPPRLSLSQIIKLAHSHQKQWKRHIRFRHVPFPAKPIKLNKKSIERIFGEGPGPYTKIPFSIQPQHIAPSSSTALFD